MSTYLPSKLFLLTKCPPPRSTLFPYTTLFRSIDFGYEIEILPKEELGSFLQSLGARDPREDRKSTRLNSSHEWISYAVFRLKKKEREAIGKHQIHVVKQVHHKGRVGDASLDVR